MGLELGIEKACGCNPHQENLETTAVTVLNDFNELCCLSQILASIICANDNCN